METLDEFIERLAKDIQCYFHQQPRSKWMSLKKNNTMEPRRMGHFATVYERVTFNDFSIIAKEWLSDDRSKKDADKRYPRSFGNNKENPKHAGLVFYVENGSTKGDYVKAVRCLSVIRNNPSL